VEDNSANCELAFALCQEFKHVHSNALALNYTTHSGVRKQVEVNEVGARVLTETHSKFFQGIRQQDHPEHTAFRKTTARLDRATRFLQQARSSEDLGQKIANYCSFFEALLSTSPAELSHQLSERAAFFLSNSPSERMRLFREIKRAYGIRSKIVHGDILSPSAITSLVDIARNCDDTARALMLKISLTPELSALMNEGTTDALDAYMLELIFGLNTVADVAVEGKGSDA
jgi:Apea-like HEPN